LSPHAAEITRRLDWRFLLPRTTFRRAVLFGADEPMRECARRLGLAPVVVGDSDGVPADLMLISPADGLAAIRDVADGGFVCCEVDRRRAPMLTPARLARRLRRAGLHPRGIWAVRPGLSRAESYVPLDHPAPLPWFLQTQYRARGALQRLVAACVQAFVRGDGRRLAPFAPLYVMVAVRAPDRPSSDEGEVDDGAVLVLTDSGNRAVRLWFPSGSCVPHRVTKVPKSVAFAERTRREQLAMVDLAGRLGDDLAAALPRPLGLVPWGAVDASQESVVPGVSIARGCRPGRRHAAGARRDLLAAGEWLARFHVTTRSDACDVGEQVRALCDRYLDRFGDPGAGMIADVWSTAGDLPPLPAVMRHPDFNIWNVVRDDERLHVIDWEGAMTGPPLCDLVQFTVHWHECVTRRHPRIPDESGLLRVLVERSHNTPADAAASDVFSRYMRRLAIPDEWFDVLAVTTWVELALRRERQLADAGSDGDERDRHNYGVRYVEALAKAWRRHAERVPHEVGVA
jgi:hypothetical protein